MEEYRSDHLQEIQDKEKSLLNPEPVYVKHKFIKAETIWCTSYGTFIKQLETDVIYAFGLNNYKQLADFTSTHRISSHTNFIEKHKKIAGKLNKYINDYISLILFVCLFF